MSGAVEDGQSCSWALEPGARLGRWRVVGRLGAGDDGVVYQVEEVDKPGETFALELALRPSDARAEREVALLARTQHRHVVRVHDWGRWQGPAGSHLYFVTDQGRGLPLHEWMVLTGWPTETATPPPERKTPPGDGQPLSGATPPRVAEESHTPGGTLVRLDRAGARQGGSRALRALMAFSVAVAAVAMGFVGRLASPPGAGLPPLGDGGAAAAFEGAPDAQVWKGPPSGGTPGPGGTLVPALVENPSASDAGTMTHFNDTAGVQLPSALL